MTVGQRIKARRLELGLSAEELGAKLGKSRATIYRYESDVDNMPFSVIQPLSEVLFVSPMYLMGWTDEPKTEKPDEDVPAELDPIDLELADLILSLSPAQKQEALHFVQYLAAKK